MGEKLWVNSNCWYCNKGVNLGFTIRELFSPKSKFFVSFNACVSIVFGLFYGQIGLICTYNRKFLLKIRDLIADLFIFLLFFLFCAFIFKKINFKARFLKKTCGFRSSHSRHLVWHFIIIYVLWVTYSRKILLIKLVLEQSRFIHLTICNEYPLERQSYFAELFFY